MPTETILLASSRKGTHLILTALAQHPAVLAHRQLLQQPDFMPDATGHEVADYFFSNPPPNCKAILAPVSWAGARGRHPWFWDELRRRKVQVIHLHRRNMLSWYVSCLVAAKTNQWIALDKPPPSDVQVEVDLKAFARAVIADWRHERQATRFFAGHKMLHLTYEDFAADTLRWNGAGVSIQSLLGLAYDYRMLRPKCHKQATTPLRKTISNFPEVAAALTGTPWEPFLADELMFGVTPKAESTP